MSEFSFFRVWCACSIPLAVVATLILLVTYVNNQQQIRLSANEPQEWLAHDIARRIAEGIDPVKVLPSSTVDVVSDQAPYIITYNREGSTTAATGVFRGKVSVLPQGVLDYAKEYGTHRITWEPIEGERHAVIVVSIEGGKLGYVLSGRSLRYAEEQERLLKERIIFGWMIILLSICGVSAVAALLLRKRKSTI